MNELDRNDIDYTDMGADERYVAAAPSGVETAIDEALGLQPISIRLQKSLLDNLKALAQLNGIGYQPLVRQILTRWVDSELKNLLREKLANERAAAQQKAPEVALENAEPLKRAA